MQFEDSKNSVSYVIHGNRGLSCGKELNGWAAIIEIESNFSSWYFIFEDSMILTSVSPELCYQAFEILLNPSFFLLGD